MKVVINTCFGGFGLSPLAIKTIAAWQGRDCFFFKTSIRDIDKYEPCDAPENNLFWFAFDIPNPNELLAYPNGKSWHEMTSEERIAHGKLYQQHHFDSRWDDRTHPLLIRVVEELKERANGRFAELRIVEIPDGTNYQIDEYDGNESIHEVHRSWV